MNAVLTRALPGFSEKEMLSAFKRIEVLEKGRPLTPEELKDALRDADVVICQLTDRISASTSSRLKCVVTFSVGLDHLDVDGLKNAGIRIAHTPDALTQATANLTWTLILGACRRSLEAAEWLRENRTCGFGPGFFLGQGIEASTLGILGMGRIGQAVADRAKGFGMKLIYHNRTRLGPEAKHRDARYVDFEELLQESDVLTVHCPLTPATRHLIGAKALNKMKKRSVLVNTARGPIIDEEALVEHLEKNLDFRVGLDVYEQEPLVHPRLLKAPNAFCLPHIGSAERETRERMTQLCMEQAIAFAKGRPLRYEV